MLDDPTIVRREPDPHGLTIYRKVNHLMNKLPHAIRVRVEQEIDVAMRADRGSADNAVIVRVYNPEINTHEKLVRLLLEGIFDDVDSSLHPSTMRRIVLSYMEDKGIRLSFATNDLNACPNCKDMSHALLRFPHEGKMILKHLAEYHAQQSSDAVS